MSFFTERYEQGYQVRKIAYPEGKKIAITFSSVGSKSITVEPDPNTARALALELFDTYLELT